MKKCNGHFLPLDPYTSLSPNPIRERTLSIFCCMLWAARGISSGHIWWRSQLNSSKEEKSVLE